MPSCQQLIALIYYYCISERLRDLKQNILLREKRMEDPEDYSPQDGFLNDTPSDYSAQCKRTYIVVKLLQLY